MTNRIFAYNGDTDGICAAHQFFLSDSEEYESVTGVKRDIRLLARIKTEIPISITVFDIAIEKNSSDIKRLLDAGCTIRWFDHHVSENIPQHPHFQANVDIDPLVNTSLIVSRFLGRKSLWAVVGLFGDNIFMTAESLAKEFELSRQDIDKLKEMGELFNYNAYGEVMEDLHLNPAEILESMREFGNPLEYMENTSVVVNLRSGMEDDLAKAASIQEEARGVYLFPNGKWAKRVIGVFANRKAQSEPDMAHAVLVEKEGGSAFTVSVRSPMNSEKSAAKLCKMFATGGGRIKAAGINRLEVDELPNFIEKFNEHYS